MNFIKTSMLNLNMISSSFFNEYGRRVESLDKALKSDIHARVHAH